MMNLYIKNSTILLGGVILFLLMVQFFCLSGLYESRFLSTMFIQDPIGVKQWIHSFNAILLNIDFVFLLFNSHYVISSIYMAIFLSFIVNLYITFNNVNKRDEIKEAIYLITPMVGMIGTFTAMSIFMNDSHSAISVLSAWKEGFADAINTTILSISVYILNIIINLFESNTYENN